MKKKEGPTAESALRGYAQFYGSRRGKKELKSSRDKKCKARTVVGRGGEEPAM